MRVNADYLILGSGIAGLSLALKLSKLGRVAIATKDSITEGATKYAQGGIAAVFLEDDSFESHIKDTLEAGGGLCDPKAVEITVKEGPQRVRELIDLGVPFSKHATAESTEFPYDLTREGGHHARRILHASDYTGRAIEDTLVAQAQKIPNIELFEHHIGVDLIVKRGRCVGAYVLDKKSNVIKTFSARQTILATGGAGKVYLYTSNPDIASGDGIAMAHRAGARVGNLEFMQFHPTCLYHPQAKSFLISEAIRGEGGELIDSHGRPFMKRYHSMGSLAPRDIVARAIDTEMKRTGDKCVFIDLSKHPAEFWTHRFPQIYETCLKFGIDISKDRIPVVPAAHYTCGGIVSDENGESTIPGLFAIGEVACTGLHGANRLASNSLLEGVVFAHRAFEKILKETKYKARAEKTEVLEETLPEWDTGKAVPLEERITIEHTWRELRTLMWNYVGIVRTDHRLEMANARIQLIQHEVHEYYWKYLLTADLIELRNLVMVASLIVQSAIARKESRGLHFNIDHPERDDRFFSKDTIL